MNRTVSNRPSMCPPLRLTALTGVAFAIVAGGASAFSINTGNPDLQVYWDNTVRLNVGWRTESIDNAIGDAFLFDESDYRFEDGDLIGARADLLSEFDLIWRNKYGFRISATGWYDDVYDDTDVKQNPEFKAAGYETAYFNNSYSSLTKNYYRGPYGEVLDAFVFGNWTIGEVPLTVKAGQLTTFWGMSLFYLSGISESQHPIDGRKGAANPGTEVKELFLPLSQINLQAQLTPTIGFEAQYYLDWDSTRSPEGGTYLGLQDVTLDGPDQLGYLGTAFPNLPRLSPVEPGDKYGDWGLALKFNPDFLQGQTIGVYYREFDEKVPWGTAGIADDGTFGYRFVYAEDAKLAGLSFDGSVGTWSVGAELGYHMDAALKTQGFAVVDEGARGDTWHALVNGVYLLTPTPLWDTGTFVAELTYDRLDKVTQMEGFYAGEGEEGCRDDGRQPNTGDVSWGCATRDAWGLGLAFSPQWLQVLPSLDLSLPIKYSRGLDGNSAIQSGVNEDAGSWSAGLELKYKVIHFLTVSYADSFAKRHTRDGIAVGGNGSGWGATDRGRVTITYKVSF